VLQWVLLQAIIPRRCEKKAHLHCCVLSEAFGRIGKLSKNYLKERESPRSIQDFVKNAQSEEMQHMVRIFSDVEYVFSLLPVKRNGWCIFESVVSSLRLDFADFVKMKFVCARFFQEFNVF
jgi:hypothetical protein